ncbi:hypothetical protein SAMN04488028_105214 [Reichenbachiella agariperforans]|uniref:Polyketide cyclase / dehydrase and lipid transport n=1 Tax=Reichenbachiella agariperforans TaxID=156994 RepID=A0A1M6SZ59_REIAG|nr:hypothetical protein [Reichenbachiella agariperforans]SHK49947.1 hypothetical protein SAMN04488028_105214 [Reichenbachiella agariperforans]
MKKIQQKYGLLLIGVSIGVLYGLITRVVFDEKATLASVTYLFVIPTILGIVPLGFANNEQLKSYKNIIFIPWLTTATFFLTMFLIGLEEFICLLVLAGPFFILGTIGAFIYRLVQLNKEKRKGKLLSLLLVPFLLSPLEQAINSPSSIYQIENEVVISSTSENIWSNIIEVKPIHEAEYKSGFFNRIGIPRPISAEVDKKEVGGQRIGNFEGGLEFKEHISEYDLNNSVSFSIHVTPESIRQNVFDQHVLNGNYFNFVNATYKLKELEDGKVLLKLSSNYQLTSKINLYGKFWGDIILGDFQERLLYVIANRCEMKEKAGNRVDG